jgi:tRNA (guanine37-N1)-methyltransferase
MKFAVVTLFPEMFVAFTEYGVVGRAFREGLTSLECWNPRDFSTDKHQTVDDRPYGGGPGMVMRVEPLAAAVKAAKASLAQQGQPEAKVVYLSPQGKRLNQHAVKEFAQDRPLVLVAGRYEGVDERFIQQYVDEEWSIGDYVLSGGELAAMVLMDAVVRHLPGTLGHELSAAQDSFSEGLLDYPHYTRPESFLDAEGKEHKVPDVLLSGNHEKIRRWRHQQSLARTSERRSDLFPANQQAVNQHRDEDHGKKQTDR